MVYQFVLPMVLRWRTLRAEAPLLIESAKELGSLLTKISQRRSCESLMFLMLILESLFIEIFIPQHKSVAIGVIYLPPSDNTLEFIEKVNEIISGVSTANKHCHITGDFNLDLLKHESHTITTQKIELLFAFGFQPMITKPTKIQHIP